MIDGLEIEELRKNILSIMDAIHESCIRNDIQYFIVSGTALGAVRHKGFIPWDTDIDVAMKRKDYNRFIELSDRILPNEYQCLHYGNQNEWYHPHALVVKKETMIHWNPLYYANKIDSPIYVDLFPLDSFPDTARERARFEQQTSRKLYLLSRRECVIYCHNTKNQIRAKQAFAGIHKAVCSGAVFNKQLDLLMEKYSEEDCREFGIIPSRYGFQKESINEEMVGIPRLYEFEGRRYYGYEKMDEYLSQLYGNYMEYPAPEDRQQGLAYIDAIDC